MLLVEEVKLFTISFYLAVLFFSLFVSLKNRKILRLHICYKIASVFRCPKTELFYDNFEIRSKLRFDNCCFKLHIVLITDRFATSLFAKKKFYQFKECCESVDLLTGQIE